MSTEILIIDDNADIRSILKDLIEDAGFKTVEQFWRNHNFLGAIAIK